MTIEEYLAELRRRLPSTRRRRFLAEAEAHLQDAAAAHRERGHAPETAERMAVDSFGDAELVARRFALASAPVAVRRASVVALLAVLGLVLPVYGIPENTLPPAQWSEKPRDVAVLQGVSIACWLLAIVLGAAAVALSLGRRGSAATAVLLGATAVVFTLFVSVVALVVVWIDEAPSTPIWPFAALVLPSAAICLAACGSAFAWARRRSRPLEPLARG